jgi:hypothetical protein
MSTERELTDWLTDLQMIQNTAEAPGDWREEFTAWYVPERWIGVHRAACVFIGNKMWELRIRSAAEIASLRALIENHNAECIENCKSAYNREARGCNAYASRMLQCPECPMEDLIELPAAQQSGEEVASLRADAERYRWLRTHYFQIDAPGVCVHGVHNFGEGEEAKRLDSEIDRMMNAIADAAIQSGEAKK